MVVVTVMSVLVVVAVAVAMTVGTPVMSSVGVIVQNLHNDEVADQSKDASQKHDERFVDYLLVDHPGSGLYEEFDCDNVDDGNIDECSQRLCLLPAEGEVFGRVGQRLVLRRRGRRRMRGEGEEGRVERRRLFTELICRESPT